MITRLRQNKLLSSTFWSVGSAGINLITNYFIIRFLGIGILGEFAVFSSYIALGTLIFNIIPSNYSIIKYQDDPQFVTILINFFISASVIYTLYLLVINLYIVNNVTLLVSIFYCIPIAWQNFLDISMQAENKLNHYFFILFLISFSKLLIFILLYSFFSIKDLNGFLICTAIPQSVLVIWLLYNNFKSKSIELNPRKSILFISKNIKVLSPYYLNTIVKRIRENSIILLFSPFVSKEIIGIYSLFIKIEQFVLGMTRNIEAFFMNKANLASYSSYINTKRKVFLFISVTVFYIATGILYMYLMTGMTYYVQIIILCTLAYLHIEYLLARSHFLTRYKNSQINTSETLFVVMVVLFFTIFRVYNLWTLTTLLLTYYVSKFVLYNYLIFKRFNNVD